VTSYKIVYYIERDKSNQGKDFEDFIAVKSVKMALSTTSKYIIHSQLCCFKKNKPEADNYS